MQGNIFFRLPGLNYFDRDDWEKLSTEMAEAMIKFETSMRSCMPKVKSELLGYLSAQSAATEEELND